MLALLFVILYDRCIICFKLLNPIKIYFKKRKCANRMDWGGVSTRSGVPIGSLETPPTGFEKVGWVCVSSRSPQPL